MFRVFDFYLFKNLGIATVFVTFVLSVLIFLTQSLRFLELVINSGTSGSAFWVLTMLAIPRFFEIILPLAIMAGTFFVYNRMTIDSELVVVRSSGRSHMTLAKPAILLACMTTVFLWFVTMWLAPASLSNMQKMRQEVKAQFSTLLFRDGVFNAAGPGLTLYLEGRTQEGELLGLMIHDSRDKNKTPSTIMAKRGIIVSGNDGYQVVVYDGARQEYNAETKTISELNFERYIIDLPDSGPVRQRWQEPDERTIFELLSPDTQNERDMESLREFQIEIHRRIISPLLAFTFTMIALVALLPGPIDRHGQGMRIIAGIVVVVTLQGLYLAAFNVAKNNNIGLALMYAITLGPLFLSGALLSGVTEPFRRRLLFGYKGESSS